MRYTQLRAFHAVAQAGTVTAAAQALHVSQPTLTTQIRALEEHYAVELFVRTGGRLHLTEAGRQLQQIAQRLFADEAEARHFLLESQGLRTGHLQMGAVGPFHATEMLVAFHARYPQIEISVSVGNSQRVLQDLLEFHTDVAVLAYVENDPRLWVSQYSKDAIIVFARSDHPLLRPERTGVRISELHGVAMVARELGSNTRRATDAAMKKAGVKPKIIMEIGSREAVREAVASGVGFGVVSSAEYVPDSRIACLPFLDVEIYNDSNIVCLRDRRNSRLIKAFIDSALEKSKI
ncbi:LysR substrate-binding domain-containing protein [Methylobacterium sp. J-070]|uniref:LysR substrate-binding domain-containing protein n=1 Tax=Methylobacterium sp. J-070 TaxID=2836650 RepID=UPI001FBBFDCF|nr:LysR substrate-binding domain-containing protein [Methylobacterium sp. J-070]MCJ2048458.1 LysR substrate-binding domain-containing protein [Methylobacterium sp. J-070]